MFIKTSKSIIFAQYAMKNSKFANKVLCVIRLSPCQLDHAVESLTMIKVITKFTGLHRHYEKCGMKSTKSNVPTLLAHLPHIQWQFMTMLVALPDWQLISSNLQMIEHHNEQRWGTHNVILDKIYDHQSSHDHTLYVTEWQFYQRIVIVQVRHPVITWWVARNHHFISRKCKSSFPLNYTKWINYTTS